MPNAEEKKKFQEASSGMRKWYSDKFGSEWLDKLDVAVKRREASTNAEFAAANQ
ncbi:MAG: hypothetical protein R3D29_15900 [Nitratireductor sp.]